MVKESVIHLSTCIQLRMTKYPSGKVMNFRHLLGCDTIVVERVTIGRSFSQPFEVEPKHCVVKMGITCQDLTNHRISQNRDIGF